MRSSRHKAAAQRFLAFLVSTEGQEIIAHSISFEYPIASGVKTVQPETPFDELKPNPIDVGELGTGSLAISLLRDVAASLIVATRSRSGGRGSSWSCPCSSWPCSRCRSPSSSPRPMVSGLSNVWHLIWRSLTASLLWNTVRLTFVVTILCAVIGTLAAYGVERTDLPGRSIWAVLVVVPFAIPDFVVSFGWSSLSTWVQGFRGAVLVMTLAVYPLVYLPVAASLRGADPGQEEIARSLGASRLKTFFRITLGQARRAILGGCLLVALVILAEYGAFEILGFQTFTTEIFTEFNIADTSVACALSLVLVLLSLVVLAGESTFGGGRRVSRTGPGAQRVLTRRRLGRARPAVLLGYLSLVVAALGVPIGSSVYWIFEGGAHSLTGASLGQAALHTAGYGLGAALIATTMALPVALLVARHPGRLHLFLERTTFLVLALPGIVVALALVVLHRPLRERFRLSDSAAFDPRLLDHVLPARPRVRAGVCGPVARRPGGGGGLARAAPRSRPSCV